MPGHVLRDLPPEFRNVPWITERGIDMTKYPLDEILARAVSADREDARAAVSLIGAASAAGRHEAGICLLGLLAEFRAEDLQTLEYRGRVVEQLKWHHSAGCAAALFEELRRVTSSNTTRR